MCKYNQLLTIFFQSYFILLSNEAYAKVQNQEYFFTQADFVVVSLMNDFHVRETAPGYCSREVHCHCALTVLRLVMSELQA